MPTFRYDKLVRDTIGELHIDAGHVPEITHLSNDELVVALCKKLREEADEVDEALNEQELIEELADVQQIIDDLCAVTGISKVILEEQKKQKADKKGGFQKGVYISTVTIPDENDEWAVYCRKSPEKYPEIGLKDE